MAGEDTTAITKSSREEMQQVYEQVCNKLENNAKIETTQWLTNGEWTYNKSATPILISKITDVRTLINILGFLIEKTAGYTKAIELLKLKNAPAFEWTGYTFEQWSHDISLRVQMITFETEKNALTKAKADLEKYFTPDDRLAKTLDSIKAIL
jgi:hypothetical protein